MWRTAARRVSSASSSGWLGAGRGRAPGGVSDELTALLVLERAGGVVHAGVGAGGPPRVTVQHASLHAAAGRTSGHPPTPRALGLPNVPMGGRHAPPHPSLPFVGGAHNHHPTDAPLVWCHMQRRGYAKGAAKKKQPKRKPSFGQALPTNTGLKNALEKYGPALMEALTPKQVAREDLSEEEKAEFEARAKEYSRKKMAQHREWQADLDGKIRHKRAAIAALPEGYLRDAAMAEDHALFPLRRTPLSTAPIPGYYEKKQQRSEEVGGEEMGGSQAKRGKGFPGR